MRGVKLPQYTRFPAGRLLPWQHAATALRDAQQSGLLALTPEEAGRLSFVAMEACGFVVGVEATNCYSFIQCENRALDPEHEYRIAGQDHAILERYVGLRALGVWHTHPPESETGPVPSSTDLDYAPVGLRQFLIFRGVIREFDLYGKEVGAWRTSGAEDA